MRTHQDIRYTQRHKITPEDERNALANVYKFVLDCRAKKVAPPESRPDARKENLNASGEPSIPRMS
jgi:hypothetical protein